MLQLTLLQGPHETIAQVLLMFVQGSVTMTFVPQLRYACAKQFLAQSQQVVVQQPHADMAGQAVCEEFDVLHVLHAPALVGQSNQEAKLRYSNEVTRLAE